MNLIELKNVGKNFILGQTKCRALHNINLKIQSGEFVGVMGKSGSGKTTLLNLIGCLDRPSCGEVWIHNQNTSQMKDTELSYFRAHELGFIFQTFNLLPVLTALENVEYPLLLLKLPAAERKQKALKSLERVGLGGLGHHRPAQLSGGQRQRVAIARAIVKTPQVILADEPTANLDSTTGQDVIDLLVDLRKDLKTTIIYCSHDQDFLRKADRILHIKDGQLVSVEHAA